VFSVSRGSQFLNSELLRQAHPPCPAYLSSPVHVLLAKLPVDLELCKSEPRRHGEEGDRTDSIISSVADRNMVVY
jgi:hypothetical protein